MDDAPKRVTNLDLWGKLQGLEIQFARMDERQKSALEAADKIRKITEDAQKDISEVAHRLDKIEGRVTTIEDNNERQEGFQWDRSNITFAIVGTFVTMGLIEPILQALVVTIFRHLSG